MTVLFVLENYYPNIGGVETLFKNLTEELVKQGKHVQVLTTQLDKNDPKYECINGVEVYRYPFKNRYFFTFFAVFPIFKHLKKADLVHTTSYNAGLPAFIASKLKGKKVIITFHEVWGNLWFKLPYMNSIVRYLHYSFEQMLVRLPFDKFIAVSESTAESLEDAGIKKDKIVVNYNGIDYDRVQALATDTTANNEQFTYTYCGRLGISKGIDYLLEAAQLFREQSPNSVLKMIIPQTPEPFYKTILNEIEKKGLQDYIQLQHNLPDDELAKEIRSSDCILIPSYSEGFCFVAAECIALGVPIISSDQKALREVVSGRFIKMKEHSVEALLAALHKAQKGEWEETPIKQFHLKDSVQRYIDLYENI